MTPSRKPLRYAWRKRRRLGLFGMALVVAAGNRRIGAQPWPWALGWLLYWRVKARRAQPRIDAVLREPWVFEATS